jgi:hypothetical protein
MSEILTVYFSSRTGHVLGAVTRAAGTIPSPPRAASLEDVLVRGVKTFFPYPAFLSFLVPATELSTLVLPPHPSLLPKPLDFQVPAQIDKVERLPNLTVTSVDLTATEITVAVYPAVAEDTAVWVLIIGNTLTVPRIASGVIFAGNTEAKLPLGTTLAPGNYDVLTLVRRHQLFAVTATISTPSP